MTQAHFLLRSSIIFMPLFLVMTVKAEIYTWKDARGVSHYTNSMYDVPERYQARVKTLNLGIEEKSADRQQQIATPGAAPSTTAPVAAPQPIAAPPQPQSQIFRQRQKIARPQDPEGTRTLTIRNR